MIKTGTRDATLCASAVEIAELFAGTPSAATDGQLLDLLVHRLEASRDLLQRPVNGPRLQSSPSATTF